MQNMRLLMMIKPMKKYLIALFCLCFLFTGCSSDDGLSSVKKLVCKLHNYIKFTESLMYKGFRVIFDLHKNYILTT